MADAEEEAEELLQQSKEQKRYETEPSKTADDSDDVSLEDAVTEAYERIDEGEVYENLTVRDEDLAALFAALEETGQLEEVGESAADTLGRDPDTLDTRAAVLKLLVRVALDDVAPETIQSAKEGRREYLASQADEF